MQWITSAGGPLVCAASDAARTWRGTRASSVNSNISDYERACSTTEFAAVIRTAQWDVLVLGDEPLQSTLLIIHSQATIARWVSARSHDIAAKALAMLPQSLPAVGESTRFTHQGKDLVLFDAAMDGREQSPSNGIQVGPGRYDVTSETYKKPTEFEFVIHRFLPALSS
jgi:hypothetical protein